MSEQIHDRVRAIAARVMDEQGVSAVPEMNVSLGEEGLGLNSMGRLELLRAIEQELNVTIPEAYWGSKRFRDLDEVAQVVSKL